MIVNTSLSLFFFQISVRVKTFVNWAACITTRVLSNSSNRFLVLASSNLTMLTTYFTLLLIFQISDRVKMFVNWGGMYNRPSVIAQLEG